MHAPSLMTPSLELKLRFWKNDEIALGPGKADLLQAIDDTGSITAAARQMEMSYRRAWLLVDTMNRCFSVPLVKTLTGGPKGGGACITEAGHEVLTLYRKMQRKAEQAIESDVSTIIDMLTKTR